MVTLSSEAITHSGRYPKIIIHRNVFELYYPHFLLATALTIFWLNNFHEVLTSGSAGASLTWLTLGGLFVLIVLTLQIQILSSLPESEQGPGKALVAIHCANLTANAAIIALDFNRNGFSAETVDYLCIAAVAATILFVLCWKSTRFFTTPMGRAVLAGSLRGMPQLLLAISFVIAGNNSLSAMTLASITLIAVLRTAPVLRQWRAAGSPAFPVLAAELGNTLTLIPLIAVWAFQG